MLIWASLGARILSLLGFFTRYYEIAVTGIRFMLPRMVGEGQEVAEACFFGL